ncbi:hypothetical protein NEMBOFW57_008134 [Staphylotrichum longicolle]|uniref:Uncharacterized protein n=1 Tax=Staphylotrichum longicolle TaxID=669026 RepID=A0AAD4HWW3_9PEZI|nr:hypothetical protein NEMBOFW57_008134 [Staphylotrichum longicolle]
MQFSNFVTMFALVMTATAVPVENTDKVLASRHDGDYHDYACCNPPATAAGWAPTALGRLTSTAAPLTLSKASVPHPFIDVDSLEHPFKIEEAPGCTRVDH